MEMRRLFDQFTIGKTMVIEPRCIGVEVFHTGDTPQQTFRRGLVQDACAAGWMVVDGDTLKLKAVNVELSYSIDRHPGYYVKSTGGRIALSELAMWEFLSQPVATLAPAEARGYLAACGLQPTDYEATRNYQCTLSAGQHALWRSVRDIAGNVVAAQTAHGG